MCKKRMLTLLELDQGKEQNDGIVKHANGPQSSAGYLCLNRRAWLHVAVARFAQFLLR